MMAEFMANMYQFMTESTTNRDKVMTEPMLITYKEMAESMTNMYEVMTEFMTRARALQSGSLRPKRVRGAAYTP